VTVTTDSLPIYPIDRAERLDGHSFVKWQTARWLSSRTWKLAGWEVQGMLRGLFDLCQTESPIGTLPDDDEELAVMLRVTPARVRELRAMEMGPLRNWSRCLCGGVVRLAHPVVTETILDALERRSMAQLSKEQKAVAVRMERLRKALLAQGVDKAVVADDVLITRMDEWIEGTHKGNRTAAVYRSAILHAAQSRWFERGHWAGG
jgi:hypothetical protein